MITINKQFHDGEIQLSDIPYLPDYPAHYPYKASEIQSDKVLKFMKTLKDRNPGWKFLEEKYFYGARERCSLVGGGILEVPEAKMEKSDITAGVKPGFCFTSAAMSSAGFRLFYGAVDEDGNPAVFSEIKSGIAASKFIMEDHVNALCRHLEKSFNNFWLMVRNLDFNFMTRDDCYATIGQMCGNSKARAVSRVAELSKEINRRFDYGEQIGMLEFMFMYGKLCRKQPTYNQPFLLHEFSEVIYQRYPQTV